jgi:hypothetical protein
MCVNKIVLILLSYIEDVRVLGVMENYCGFFLGFGFDAAQLMI